MKLAEQVSLVTACTAIINSMKHARTDDGIVTILVRCQAIEGGARVEISDNGGGLPDASVPETDDGLGFRLMRAHAKAAGGMITFETSRCGLKVELTVPIDRTPQT
jgi:two-component sensor histidine kinase